VLKQVHAIKVKSFKFTPEPLVNSHNQTFTYSANGGATSGTITLPKGDYDQSLIEVITMINSYLNAFDVAFTIDPVTGLVNFTFSGPFATSYFEIPYCGILQMLGFTSGIHLYKTGYAPPLTSLAMTTQAFQNTAIAVNPAVVVNNTDLILRIADVEAIHSIDSVCNRASAILMSNRTPNGVAYLDDKDPYPLLQIQSRISVLRVQILNSNGDLYDLNNNDATFLIEFHCAPEGTQCI
jgi:hypothetical protein